MPYIPPQVAETELSKELTACLGVPRQGKVRDTYQIPSHPDKLLVVATDRLSIFDFVLGCHVENKGAVLTSMTVFWLISVIHISNHMLAWGDDVDEFLPEALCGNAALQSRALVVQKLNMIPVECIIRRYLTGSGLKSYKKTGQVCGIALPAGLHDGSELDKPLFTPTDKAEDGHDLDLDAEAVDEKFGPQLGVLSKLVCTRAADYAYKRGIIIADTKFEFGRDEAGNLVLADEVLTPDSSRFWNASDWITAAANFRSPSGFDKQPVREWGKNVATPFVDEAGKLITGIHNLDPANSKHQQFVGELLVPEEVTTSTTNRYLDVFKRLTGLPLVDFQNDIMGIDF